MSYQGVVKFYLDVSGYGFIESPDMPDSFVHARELRNSGIATLKPGDLVGFDLRETDGKRAKACNIRLAA